MANGEEVLMMEGFLCPICKADLGTAVELLAHFQEEHTDEQDLLKSFKDLLGKAKKKFLKQDDGDEFVPFSSNRVSPTHYVEWKPQEIGASVSHMLSFEKDRSARLNRFSMPTNLLLIRLDKLMVNMPADPIKKKGASVSHMLSFGKDRSARLNRFSMPTNLLLIRLDKLMVNMPADPIKKKAHEQKVVPWLDGTSVTRCPNCTRSFYLTRRQHHCRLCGSVLCHDCSSFLALNTARKILNKPEEDEEEEASCSDLNLRICQHCLNLLETREQLKEARNSKPIISQFYERLCEYRTQADEHAAVYNKMAKSLNSGESTYNLNDAQLLRVKLLRLADSIDALSNKIAVLGTKDTENPPQGQGLRLQKAVRTAAAGYLRNTLLSLPVLPSEEQLKALHERRIQINARLLEEKEREKRLRDVENVRLVSNSVSKQGSPQSRSLPDKDTCSVGQGWVPGKKQQFYKSDDPLIEQMNIIRNYIQEARLAQKFEEVASLEANLQELKQEYWRCQQQLEQERLEQSETTNGKEVVEEQRPAYLES